MWNSKSNKCTGSPLLLSKSSLACDSDSNGLVKLDEKGKMVVCNGEKKKYAGVGSGGAAGGGLSEDMPATNCEAAMAASRFFLKSGKYWILGSDKKTAYQRVCDISSSQDGAEDLGGDGSDTNNAARDCWALKSFWGAEGKAMVYIRNKGKVECDFTLGDPAAYADWAGEVNKYAPMATSYSKGHKDSILLMNRQGHLSSFKAGNWVLIHQTQHPDFTKVGQYEWNWLKEDVDGTSAELFFPLKHDYCSGTFEKTDGTSCVTQLVRTPYVVKGNIKSGVTARAWDGYSGGIVALKATENIAVNAEVNVDGKGFRGGREHYFFEKSGGCKGNPSAGDQGESFKGRGKRDGVSAGFGCCRGKANAPRGYNGRGLANGGGGGGGGGACHGGGGAGGGYGTWSGVGKCANRGYGSNLAGDGSPETGRAGSWSVRGDEYGDANMVRPQLGSGGGGGNSYSPNSRDKNGGGEGGGLIFLDGGKSVDFGSGKLSAKGKQGFPRAGTSLYNWWQRSNSQDGSGGGGSGGGILLEAREGDQKVNIKSKKVDVQGGLCGANTGWNKGAQMGGGGGKGRFAIVAKTVAGTPSDAASYKKVDP